MNINEIPTIKIDKKVYAAVYEDVCGVIAKHAAQMDAMEILALMSNILGKVIAMQDQRVMTPVLAMKIVEMNIEAGNQEMIEALHHSAGEG